MKCKMLNEDLWKRLLQDKLTKEESLAIYDHLDTDCPDCEEFLANMSMNEEIGLSKIRDDLLHQDPLLMTASTDPALPMAEVRDWDVPASRLNPHLTQWLGGIAALLVISVGILPQLHINQSATPNVAPIDFQKAKGYSTPENIFKLDFSTGYRQGEDSRLSIERGQQGVTYSDNALLFFQYETKESGYVYLVGIQEGAEPELLYPPVGNSADRLPPGEYNVSINDEILAYPLTGLHGRYTVVGIFSPEPLDIDKQMLPSAVKQSLDPVTGNINNRSLGAIGNDVAIDEVHIKIGT